MLKKLNNYLIFLFSNSLLSVAMGLFGPYFILFVRDFGGGIQQFGFALGLMVATGAIASYFAGKYSDKLGRKKLLIIGGYIMVLIILAYTFITSIWQLYILQILNGMTTSMLMTMEVAFLGDVTKKEKRGADIGKYHAIIGVIGGITMMAGGLFVNLMGLKSIFYIVATVSFVSTTILLWLKEK